MTHVYTTPEFKSIITGKIFSGKNVFLISLVFLFSDWNKSLSVCDWNWTQLFCPTVQNMKFLMWSIISVRDKSTTDIIRLSQYNMVPFTYSDGTIDSSANSEEPAWVCIWSGMVTSATLFTIVIDMLFFMIQMLNTL